MNGYELSKQSLSNTDVQYINKEYWTSRNSIRKCSEIFYISVNILVGAKNSFKLNDFIRVKDDCLWLKSLYSYVAYSELSIFSTFIGLLLFNVTVYCIIMSRAE